VCVYTVTPTVNVTVTDRCFPPTTPNSVGDAGPHKNPGEGHGLMRWLEEDTRYCSVSDRERKKIQNTKYVPGKILTLLILSHDTRTREIDVRATEFNNIILQSQYLY